MTATIKPKEEDLHEQVERPCSEPIHAGQPGRCRCCVFGGGNHNALAGCNRNPFTRGNHNGLGAGTSALLPATTAATKSKLIRAKTAAHAHHHLKKVAYHKHHGTKAARHTKKVD